MVDRHIFLKMSPNSFHFSGEYLLNGWTTGTPAHWQYAFCAVE